jgi:predicted secreted hydrolase
MKRRLLLGLIATLCLPPKTPDGALAEELPINLETLFTVDRKGFADPSGPWELCLPEDLGAHHEYQTESWHFTGNLETREGRAFGLLLTLFRIGLVSDEAPPRTSAWATREIYAGHLALTDVKRNRFYVDQRISRAALGLSGAKPHPLRVWLEDWVLEASQNSEQKPSLNLKASTEGVQIELQLREVKPPFMPRANTQGSEREGPTTPFRSFSLPRLLASGVIKTAEGAFPVEGLVWIERAWGKVPIPVGQLAFNRFLLQLDDGREFMGLQLRRRDGTGVPIDSGLIVEPEGTIRHVDRKELSIEALDYWSSRKDQTRYPVRWRVQIPTNLIDFVIIPSIPDQEIAFWPRYWAGSVRVVGTWKGKPLTGNGYVELMGYADSSPRG